MSDKVKVGDMVVSLVSENDIKKGNIYEVVRISATGTAYIKDDVGHYNCLFEGQYTLDTQTPTPNNYTRILEAMLTEDQIAMAKRIAEVM
jgi:hypothetical protein